MVVYDSTDISTFNNVKRWLQEIASYSSGKVEKLLVANKCDDVERRAIDFEDAKVYVTRYFF